MKEYYIYKITCLIDDWNGKFYIGKHYGNINDCYTGSGKLIKEYFKEYGKVLDKTYVKEIIDYGDENSICDLERDYIRKAMESPLCLNLQCQSANGSKSVRDKMSISRKGKKRSNETKHKMSISAKNRKPRIFSEEGKQNISTALKGRVFSEEHKLKISNALKGRKHSEARKANMRKPHKKRNI